MPARKNLPTTGCSLVVGRLLWEQEFPGSIPGIPTSAPRDQIRGSNSPAPAASGCSSSRAVNVDRGTEYLGRVVLRRQLSNGSGCSRRERLASASQTPHIRYEEDGNLLARDARETGFNSQVPDYDVAPPRGRLRRMGHHGFLAQFGKSARLKPERSLVRFQEFLLQTCLTSI